MDVVLVKFQTSDHNFYVYEKMLNSTKLGTFVGLVRLTPEGWWVSASWKALPTGKVYTNPLDAAREE